jgi:hypothetical protein
MERVHDCPSCTCAQEHHYTAADMGVVNTSAPFYGLVTLISQISHDKEHITDG